MKYDLSENGIHGDSWDGDRCLLYVGWSYVFRSLFQGGLIHVDTVMGISWDDDGYGYA